MAWLGLLALLGLLARLARSYTYIAVYKPAGMLCAMRSDAPRSDRKQQPIRSTLLDLPFLQATSNHHHLRNVGRLDRFSEGLLLFTDDGDFANKVLAPEWFCPKTYHVQLCGSTPDESKLKLLRTQPLTIRGKVTKLPLSVERMTEPPNDLPPATQNADDSWLNVTISEGKNQQVRRMFKSIRHEVIRLVRVQIGRYRLSESNLHKPGEWEYIQADDVLGPDTNVMLDESATR